MVIMKNQKGQIILILVLVMTVALAIGIAVVQRSLSDISTSTKIEQSSRAFSAAEAGIEKALSCPTCVIPITNFGNQSSATITSNYWLPCVPGSVGCNEQSEQQQAPLEYPALAKEDVAHVWLADPDPNVDLPGCTKIDPAGGHNPVCYTQSTLDVYWGDPTAADRAALELSVVYYGTDATDLIDPSTLKYRSQKYFYDPIRDSRTPGNNFDDASSSCVGNHILASGVNYRCLKTITLPASPAVPMLLRARLLYNDTSQPFAVQGVNCSASGCFIPPQSLKISAVGKAGTTERKVNLFQEMKVVPFYLDYAVFSAGDINK